jgi:integrase
MPTVKMTDRWLRNLKAPDTGRIEYHDDTLPGLTLRVGSGGVKSWCVYYRLPGDHTYTKRRVTLEGRWPSLGLADARKQAREVLVRAGKSECAATEKREERQAPTFSMLAEEYMERHAKHKRSAAEDRRILAKDLLPAWGHRKAHDITRRDIVTLIDGIRDRGAQIMANRTLALAQKVFNFSIERGILGASPCVQIKFSSETPRSRVLSDAEIVAFWERLESARMAPGTALALRLVLVTAQRPGEVAGMRESEIEGDWWTLPASRAKNRRDHKVPLTQIALDLLGEARRLAKGSEWLFPSPTAKHGASIDDRAMARAVKRNLTHFGIEPFVPHDLRRTARTRFAELGVNDVIAERVLGHTLQGIARVYNHHDYGAEKRQALEAWEQKLRSLTAGDTGTVVLLRASS